MNVNMGAGLNLTGSVGAESSVESKLFLWQKTLFEKDFAEWDLATINFNFAARKKPPADGGRNGFFQGWEFDTANIELTGPDTGLGAAFTENNNPANNYGLTTTDMAPSKEYQDLQENFDTAVKLLEEFSNPQDGRTLVVPEEPDESGASEVTSKLKEQISNNFIVIWAGAQNELMLVRQTLDDYMNDGGHQAKEEQARKNVEKHSRTLSSLHVWKMQNKAANQNSEAAADKTDEKQTNAGQLLEFYNSGTNTGGHGFKKHLENRAKDEAYNFDNLLKHERERYIEKTQKHTHRILELKRLMAANRGDKEIIDYYKDTLKGSRAFKNKVAVQTVGELKKFETQKMLENQKGAREHANNTKAMLDKLSKGYEDKNGFFGGRKKYGRTEFFKEFADSLSVSSSLYCFGNKDYLVNYEKSRLLKIGGDDAKYYMNLLEGKDQFEGTDTTEKNKKKEDQKIKENYYLSATLAELREYEEQINAGEYGKALSSYTKGQEEGRPKSDNELNNIFGNKKRKALKTFKKRLRNRSVDDNIKFISLDLLAEYIRKRQRNTSDMKIKKQLAEELQYVSNAKLRLLNIVDEEQLQEKEAEMVKEYFNRFTASAKEYQYDLETGKEVNLALMQVAFREDPDNERMNLLDKMTNDDGQEPDHFIIRQYIEAKGVDKKKLTEFLLQKRGADAFTEDNKRKFYAASMAKDKGSRKHLNRLDKLMEVSEQGTYDDLLKAYEESGGGEGYAEQIKKELATGFVGGRMISTEEVVEYENRQIRLAGTLQEDVIKLFAGMSDDQMIGDGELLQKYKERSIANEAKQKGFGAIGGSVKNAIASRGIDIDTQYEKSLKKVELTPQELLSYEIMRKEELGRKHMERIRSLLGAEAVTDEQIEKNQLPQPENVEELEDRRQAYINNAKRFEKDDDIKGQAEANLKRMMGDEDFLYKEMVEYESQRKDYYERQFIELMQAHTNLNNQIAVLEHEENISRQIVGKLDAIEHNPKIIFDEIETFRSAVDKMKTQPEEDEKMRQRQKELIQEVKDRIEQAEMLDYSDEED